MDRYRSSSGSAKTEQSNPIDLGRKMNAQEILTDLVAQKATDVFCVAGRAMSYKQDGVILMLGDERMMPMNNNNNLILIY
jgi:hypothetical protein